MNSCFCLLCIFFKNRFSQRIDYNGILKKWHQLFRSSLFSFINPLCPIAPSWQWCALSLFFFAVIFSSEWTQLCGLPCGQFARCTAALQAGDKRRSLFTAAGTIAVSQQPCCCRSHCQWRWSTAEIDHAPRKRTITVWLSLCGSPLSIFTTKQTQENKHCVRTEHMYYL